MTDNHVAQTADPVSGRNVPPKTHNLEALWEVWRDVAVLKTQQRQFEQRTREHDCALMEIKKSLSDVSASLEQHMLKEEKDRVDLFKRLTLILTGVVVSGAALIFDLVLNLSKGM